MITACVALIGVSVLAIWVSSRGGHIDPVEEALVGIGRSGRVWAAVAAGSGAAPEPDAGAPEAPAAPDAGPPEDVAATDADAGTEEVEEVEEDDAGATASAPQSTTKKPLPKKKKPIRRPRRR